MVEPKCGPVVITREQEEGSKIVNLVDLKRLVRKVIWAHKIELYANGQGSQCVGDMLLCLKIFYQACQYQFPKRSPVKSKTKGQTFRYRFRNETKTLWYRIRICLVENRLFRFGSESVLLDQIDMISFDGADSGMKTQTFWFHSC